MRRLRYPPVYGISSALSISRTPPRKPTESIGMFRLVRTGAALVSASTVAVSPRADPAPSGPMLGGRRRRSPGPPRSRRSGRPPQWERAAEQLVADPPGHAQGTDEPGDRDEPDDHGEQVRGEQHPRAAAQAERPRGAGGLVEELWPGQPIEAGEHGQVGEQPHRAHHAAARRCGEPPRGPAERQADGEQPGQRRDPRGDRRDLERGPVRRARHPEQRRNGRGHPRQEQQRGERQRGGACRGPVVLIPVRRGVLSPGRAVGRRADRRVVGVLDGAEVRAVGLHASDRSNPRGDRRRERSAPDAASPACPQRSSPRRRRGCARGRPPARPASAMIGG